jgi:hypothetical protein
MPDCGHFRYGSDEPGLAYLGLGVPALEYARLGYRVLPLDRGGKRPHRMLGRDGGVYHASDSFEQITGWWSQDPVANIGVATGRASMLMVIDLDTKNGKDGPAEFESFREAWGLPLDAPVAMQTPSGGWHSWYRWPAAWAYHQVPERPGILDGVDIKGEGGLVVAPPSMQLITPIERPGGQRGAAPVPVPYRMVTGCPCQLPEVPQWMAEWAHNAPATGHGPGGGEEIRPDEVMERGASVGSRNRTLYRLACSRYRLHGTQGTGANAAMEDVRKAWLAGDTTGMPWSEILVICESARRFIERQKAAEERNWQAHARYLQR